MKKLTIRYIATILAALGMLTFTACETSEGLGDDIEDAGDSIEDAADDAS